MLHRQEKSRLRGLPRLALVAGLLALPLAGCDLDEVLEVRDPEFSTPESLTDPDALPTLIAGAVGDFQVGYSGGEGSDSYLTGVALLTDEFVSTGTFTTRTATDQRDQFPTVQGNTTDNAFIQLQQARRSLLDAAVATRAVRGEQDPTVSRLLSLAGYSIVALGEGFCHPIPFSDVEAGELVFSEPLTGTEVWEAAVARFNEALSVDPNSQLAAVGKGRALLDAGLYQEAAAAVQGVDDSFVFHIEHSVNSPRQENQLFGNQDNGRYSVANNEGGEGNPWFDPPFPTFEGIFEFVGPFADEGGEGLNYLGATDPRVPYTLAGAGFDQNFPVFISLRYPDFGADVPLATGVEARLIQAEAALAAGNVDQWLAILNSLRADVEVLMNLYFEDYLAYSVPFVPQTADLAPLEDPGTERERLLLLFRERAFWLYNTGHRLGDLRRMIRQYGFTEDEVYPEGAYFKGGEYGEDVAFPIPFSETNNPFFTVDMCDVTQA